MIPVKSDLNILREQCERAMDKLESLVYHVREACQRCDESWAPSATEHVLHVYALLSAELGYKKEAFRIFESELASQTPRYDTSDLLEDLANWICNRPSDMLPLITEMLRDEEAE